MGSTAERVLVAMSGGVDSSVAAALLKEAGHDVVGVFMRNGIASEGRSGLKQGCCSVEDARDARRVADQLDIPFQALDLSDGFSGLIDDFLQSYAEGRTPNPCIECNRRFKMGALRTLARRLGAAKVASGHYARVVEREGRWAVERAVDREKDQSYVLHSLDQDALAETLLPLGAMTKAAVREQARRFGLRVAEKAESMDICFVPSGDYRDLVRERRPDLLIEGPIVDPEGRILGRHEGAALFTIGQRRGLPGGQPQRLHVTGIDATSGTVRVGPSEALLGHDFVLSEVVWSGLAEPAGEETLRGEVQIRSQHRPAPASITRLEDGRVAVRCDEPQRSATPGQAAVVYQGDRVVLGGPIERVGVPV